jgi:hypothetical protein
MNSQTIACGDCAPSRANTTAWPMPVTSSMRKMSHARALGRIDRLDLLRRGWFRNIAAGAGFIALASFAPQARADVAAGLHLKANLPTLEIVARAPIDLRSFWSDARPRDEDAAPASNSTLLEDNLATALRSDWPIARTILPAPASRAPDAAHAESPGPHDVMVFEDRQVPRQIVETIVKAAASTGVDPAYLMALADKESSFRPDNRAATSSAEGLFQFLEATWLEMMRGFGAKHGLDREAAAIQGQPGALTIADGAERARILDLRRDPYLAALMAAEMLKRDRTRIERRLGRTLTRSELYLAHFFGAESAVNFMSLVSEKPSQSAPKTFPAAAKANKALFYARSGRKPRHLSVSEVYVRIDTMMDERLDRYDSVSQVATADGRS